MSASATGDGNDAMAPGSSANAMWRGTCMVEASHSQAASSSSWPSLASPAASATSGAEGAFTVLFPEPGEPAARRRLRVSGSAPDGRALTRDYLLRDVAQQDYLELFGRLAEDFGTRVPRNLEPATAPTCTAPFQALLTSNLSPDIRYGYGDPAVLAVPRGPSDGTAAPSATPSGDLAPTIYYAVVTSNDAPNSFPILRSRRLTDWELVGFVFPQGGKPEWAADGENASDYWAPEMHYIGGAYRVYFAAREKASHALAIGIASAPSPAGPFVAAAEPLVRGNVIDPHVFMDPGGRAYLFWKHDSNDVWPSLLTELLHVHPQLIEGLFDNAPDRRTAALVQALWPWIATLDAMQRFFAQQVLIEAVTADFRGVEKALERLHDSHTDPAVRQALGGVLAAMRTPIYAQPLDADGCALVGERTVVLENDQGWEAHLIEGVWATQHGDKVYLFYSGNDFSTAQYGIGVAVADTPLGPYRKMAEPLARSTAEWSGPGHASVANGLDGKPQLFLHAFFPGEAGYKKFRALLTLPIAFLPDGVAIRQVPSA